MIGGVQGVCFEDERLMLWNTQGLTCTGIGAVAVLTGLALTKLCSLKVILDEVRPTAGVLLELIGSSNSMRPLRTWFRNEGYILKVLVGEPVNQVEGEEFKVRRNGVAVFYSKTYYAEVQVARVTKGRRPGTTAAGSRMMTARLHRVGGGATAITAMHGSHNDAVFGDQMDALEGIMGLGDDGCVLTDVNRRACESHSSGAAKLTSTDRRWRTVCAADCVCCGGLEPDACERGELVPSVGSGVDAATRRRSKLGKKEWSVLDRMLTYGLEVGKWTEIRKVWMELPGDSPVALSDHALMVWERGRTVTEAVHAEGRVQFPDMRSWNGKDKARFQVLAGKEVREAMARGGGEAASTLHDADVHIMVAAEMVVAEKEERAHHRMGKDDFARLECWRMRLRMVLRYRERPLGIFTSDFLRHRRSGFCKKIRAAENQGFATVIGAKAVWEYVVRCCRKEVAYFLRCVEVDKKEARKVAHAAAREDRLTDVTARAGRAWRILSKREERTKVDRVARGDVRRP